MTSRAVTSAAPIRTSSSVPLSSPSCFAAVVKAFSVGRLPPRSNAPRTSSRPSFMKRSRFSSRSDRRMAALARPVATMSIQVPGGRWPRAVMMSTACPLRSRVQSGARTPSTFAPTQLSPMRVWIAYAKSSGVAPRGSFTTSPLGVKQNTLSAYISILTCSRNSSWSSADSNRSERLTIHLAGSTAKGFSDGTPSRYDQWAATPASATSCISWVRIWISTRFASRPETVV